MTDMSDTYNNTVNSFNMGICDTVTRINKLASDPGTRKPKDRRLSYTCDEDRFEKIDARSGNNCAYIDFCVRIAESIIGDDGPITMSEILRGEKTIHHARKIKDFLETLEEPGFFDYIRKGNHKLIP